MWTNGIDTVIEPRKSLDLSVMETWVKPLKDRFTAKCCDSIVDGIHRLYDCWHALDYEKINQTIDSYPARLHECLRVVSGQNDEASSLHDFNNLIFLHTRLYTQVYSLSLIIDQLTVR